jgi:hypothetical protein
MFRTPGGASIERADVHLNASFSLRVRYVEHSPGEFPFVFDPSTRNPQRVDLG